MSADLVMRWRADCAALGASEAAAERWRGTVERAHSEPHRRYHTLEHLREVFDALDDVRDKLSDQSKAAMAGWFHDVIYDTARGDNERESARLARQALVELNADPAFAAQVGRLIEATADHASPVANLDDALFLDADMAILGAPPERYDRYAHDIRTEYGQYDDATYAFGRGDFLQRQLARTRLYHTDFFESRCAERARENMARELERLNSAG